MLPQRLKKTVTDNPKKVADLIDLVNLPTILRDFMGQSQSSHLNCFRRVWSYIKDNNLQDVHLGTKRTEIPYFDGTDLTHLAGCLGLNNILPSTARETSYEFPLLLLAWKGQPFIG
ncbi:SWIB/MDM2 domain superfamily protein [Striga hermonthica]|uniref:SWIB/MDM2 domain superfamily protein n=1 Tax=Striga hermonthica TaxID=68872 RepID=A0A9N7N0P2_STRHE|nr:SWIB/MDM2 domain superfamily protein [Striga hermonthica]